MTAEGDLELSKRCAAGDEDAWASFMRRYRSFMIDFARRIVPGAGAADVTDAVIADLWQRGKIARFEGRSTLRTWLGALVANAALNARRGAPGSGGAEPPRARELARDPGPADREASALVSEALTQAIAGLPDDDRLLILMHYEQNLSLGECGVVLGASKSTLSRRLAAVRERIRADADRMSRERHGASLQHLRSGLEASMLDVDLRVACGGPRNARRPDVSKE